MTEVAESLHYADVFLSVLGKMIRPSDFALIKWRGGWSAPFVADENNTINQQFSIFDPGEHHKQSTMLLVSLFRYLCF